MNIYPYIESPDVAAHLRSVNYTFSPDEKAYLVSVHRTLTLSERCRAWDEISAEADRESASRLQQRVRSLKESEVLFRRGDDNSIYRVDVLDAIGLDLPEQSFPSLEKCCMACLARGFPNGITIVKQWLDEPFREISAVMNDRAQITRLHLHDRQEDCTTDDDASADIRIPSPFHRGDIVWAPFFPSSDPHHREPHLLLEEPGQGNSPTLVQCLWGGFFDDAQICSVPCIQLRRYPLHENDPWVAKLKLASDLLQGKTDIAGFLTDKRFVSEKGEHAMEQYPLTIDNGMITDINQFRETPAADGEQPGLEPIRAELYIPADVCDIEINALTECNPVSIRVDPANETFRAEDNCLIRKSDNVLVMGCGNSRLREDSHVEGVGSFAFNHCRDITGMGPIITIPKSVKTLGFRSFATDSDTFTRMILHENVEKVEEMALMLDTKAELSEFVFYGDPELAPGAFGTKAEAADSKNEAYRSMPDMLYIKPESLLILGHRGSGVEAYCQKYGIPFRALDK